MTILKFMARAGAAHIEPMQVERETAQAVWVRGWTFAGLRTGEARRYAKRGQSENYFDTWEEAHTFLTKDAAGDVFNARGALQRARDYEGNVKGMKRPAVTTLAEHVKPGRGN